MFYIAICDDDAVLCNRWESYLLECVQQGEVKVEIFYTSEKLYKAICEGKHYDLIFLDVEFSQMSGIELGHIIRNELNNNAVQIVYISGREEHAMELFAVRPMNFLIKPVSKQDIIDNLETARRLTKVQNDYFECKTGAEWLRIPFREILFFESNNRKVIIHTESFNKTMYATLNQVSEAVPENFIRVHQSYLVNRMYVKKWRYNEITLINESVVPVSNTYRKELAKVMF